MIQKDTVYYHDSHINLFNLVDGGDKLSSDIYLS